MVLQRLFNYGLCTGAYGIDTAEGIEEMAKDLGTEVYSQTLASYKDTLEWLSMGWEIPNGYYKVTDGAIEINSEDWDEPIIFIPNIIGSKNSNKAITYSYNHLDSSYAHSCLNLL